MKMIFPSLGRGFKSVYLVVCELHIEESLQSSEEDDTSKH